MRIALTLAVCLFSFGWLPLQAIDELGCIHIGNPQSFVHKLDGITGRLGARVSDDLPLFAQRYLKNPLLNGIEMERPWTFVFLNPKTHTNHLAIIVGVRDAGSFYDSFGKGGVSNVKADPAASTGAIRHFTEVEDVYDHPAYLAAVRAGRKVEPFQFKQQVTKHYYITVRDGLGLIVDDAKTIDDPALLATVRDNPAVKGDIVAVLRAPAILSLYGDEMRRQKESILGAIGSAAAGDAAARAAKQLAGEFEATLNFFKHVARLEIGAELGEGRLKLKIAAPPLEGSSFGRALAGQKPAELDGQLLRLMPADAAILGMMRYAPTREWTDFLLELMKPVIEASAGNGSADKLAEAYRESLGAGGGAFAVAVLPPSTNQVAADGVEVIRVVDAKRARQVQRVVVEAGWPAFRTAAPLEGGSGIKYEADVARCEGIGIDRVSMDLGGSGETIFGAHCVQQLAFAGGFELIAQGPHGSNHIRRLIQTVTAPAGSRGGEFKVSGGTFPKQANGIFYMNLADYVGHLRNAAAMGNDAALERLQTQLAEAKASITGYLLLEARAAILELDVPLDKLIDVFIKNNAAPAPATAP